MGMLEARVRILTNNSETPVLSPQQVVSCSEYSQGKLTLKSIQFPSQMNSFYIKVVDADYCSYELENVHGVLDKIFIL